MYNIYFIFSSNKAIFICNLTTRIWLFFPFFYFPIQSKVNRSHIMTGCKTEMTTRNLLLNKKTQYKNLYVLSVFLFLSPSKKTHFSIKYQKRKWFSQNHQSFWCQLCVHLRTEIINFFFLMNYEMCQNCDFNLTRIKIHQKQKYYNHLTIMSTTYNLPYRQIMHFITFKFHTN